MSSVVEVWCGQCPVSLKGWWKSGVVNFFCGGYPFFAHSVVDVWFGLVDVIKSILMQLQCSLNLSRKSALRILGHHLHHTCKNALMANFDLGWL